MMGNIHPKVTAATVAAAVVTIVVLVLAQFGVTLNDALTSAIATLVALVAGYFTPSGDSTV